MCLAADSFLPISGGAVRRFARYLPGLRSRGIDCFVVTGASRDSGLPRSNAAREAETSAIDAALPYVVHEDTKVHKIQLPRRPGEERSRLFFKGVAEWCGTSIRPDVVLLLSPIHRLPERLSGYISAHGIPVVYPLTIWPTLPDTALQRSRKFERIWRHYEQMDCIITATGRQRRWLHDLGVTTRVEVVPNGVELERFRPLANVRESEVLRTAFGVSPDTELILSVGDVIPRKRVDLAIEAFYQVARDRPRARLVVLGDCGHSSNSEVTEYRGRIVAVCSQAHLQGRILLAGAVERVDSWLKIANAFLFTSHREGMPNAVLEAMSCGVPCVLGPFPGLGREFGIAGQHYRKAADNPASLAQELNFILANPGEAEQIGRSARELMVRTMAIDRSLDRYAAILRAVLTLDGSGKKATLPMP